MREKFIYCIILDKNETQKLRKRYSSAEGLTDCLIDSVLWEETSAIKGHWIRATKALLIDDNYLKLRVSADTMEGLEIGIEYLREFING